MACYVSHWLKTSRSHKISTATKFIVQFTTINATGYSAKRCHLIYFFCYEYIYTIRCFYGWQSVYVLICKHSEGQLRTQCRVLCGGNPHLNPETSANFMRIVYPGQNGCLFADDIFRCIFVNENFCILVKISLKCVPKCPIINNPALVQKMAWRRIGDKPLYEPMLTWSFDAYMRQ